MHSASDRWRVRTARFTRVEQFEPVERLEARTLLAAQVTSVFADNRGLVQAVVSEPLDPATVLPGSVRIYTAGADGKLGTADDVWQNAAVAYNAATRTISAQTNLPANTPYRIVLTDFIKSANGTKLDGEMITPGGRSGDGTAGGNFDAIARIPSGNPIVRYTTSEGIIDVELLQDAAPLSVANFLAYANAGQYDGTFFHRSISDFVIQGGGFYANPPTFSGVAKRAPVQNEFNISNTRGTLAFAKLPGQPDSATNEWFFNLGDNSANLDNQNGGFTVFGRITNAAGLAVMDQIGAYDTLNASPAYPGKPLDDLPVKDVAAVIDRQAVLASDLITVQRIAMQMDLAPTTAWQVGATADFDGDGNTDILWRNYNSGANVLWLMNNGTRTASIALPEPADKTWELVGAADMDGDGDIDLIWRNRVSGLNTTWLMQNNRIDSFKALPPVISQHWRLEGVGDLNGDGHVDLVWRNYNNGNNSVWFLNGTDAPANQMKALPPVYNLDYGIQAVDDFNNDGRADVVFRNARTGQNQIWFFNGNTHTGVKILPLRIDTSFRIVGSGQFDNRPGKDLFWSNTTTRINDGWSLTSAGDWQAMITLPNIPA